MIIKYISILFLVRDLIIVQKFRELAASGVKSELVRIVLTTENSWLKVFFSFMLKILKIMFWSLATCH